MTRLCRKPQVCRAAYYQWQEERGDCVRKATTRAAAVTAAFLILLVDDGSSYELSAWRRAALLMRVTAPRRFAIAARGR